MLVSRLGGKISLLLFLSYFQGGKRSSLNPTAYLLVAFLSKAHLSTFLSLSLSLSMTGSLSPPLGLFFFFAFNFHLVLKLPLPSLIPGYGET